MPGQLAYAVLLNIIPFSKTLFTSAPLFDHIVDQSDDEHGSWKGFVAQELFRPSQLVVTRNMKRGYETALAASKGLFNEPHRGNREEQEEHFYEVLLGNI